MLAFDAGLTLISSTHALPCGIGPSREVLDQRLARGTPPHRCVVGLHRPHHRGSGAQGTVMMAFSLDALGAAHHTAPPPARDGCCAWAQVGGGGLGMASFVGTVGFFGEEKLKDAPQRQCLGV
jgi:hypothetical protein